LVESENINVPVISRDPRIQTLPPVIEPPLREMPEYEGALADAVTEVVRSGEMEAEYDFRRAAEATALNDERVTGRLGARYEVIGVSLVEDKEARAFTPLLIVYNYDENKTLEISMTAGSEPEVADIVETDHAPPPTDAEIERAIGLARGDRRIASDLPDGFEAVAILASDVDAHERFYGGRYLAVGFGPADERMPRVRAIVDLSRERVLAVSTDGVGT